MRKRKKNGKVVDIGIYRSRPQLRQEVVSFDGGKKLVRCVHAAKILVDGVKKMDRTRSGCHPLEEFENHALLPGIEFTPSEERHTHTRSSRDLAPSTMWPS